MKHDQNLIWIDLEMTGLDPDNDRILELATLVTDGNLNVLAEGPVFAVHQDEASLAAMDAWNTKHHGQSGLTQRVRDSLVTEAEAEHKTLDFLAQFVDKGKSPMCGNTICQDRRFLCRYMPTLAAFFHYRHVDVSTLKELSRRWAPQVLKGVVKQSKHLAMDDIKESIEEMRYYREHFIQASTGTGS